MRKMEDILYTRIYRKTAQCEYNGINNLKSIIEDNFPELNKDLSLQIENFRLFINFYGKNKFQKKKKENKFLKCIQ